MKASPPTRDREFGVTAPKVSLAQVWELPGDDTLLIINIHGLAFEGGKKLAGFRRQLAAIEEVVGEHDGAVLLAGDFNTWSTHRLGYVQEMAKRLRLVEIDEFVGPVPRTTADLGSDASNKSFGVNPDFPLDHVFVRLLTSARPACLTKPSRTLLSDTKPELLRFARRIPRAGA